MPVERFDDLIDFVPACPNGCEVEALPTMTRYVAERTPNKMVDGRHRWLVCCPKCFVAYYTVKGALEAKK